jgi:hypothetical protein
MLEQQIQRLANRLGSSSILAAAPHATYNLTSNAGIGGTGGGVGIGGMNGLIGMGGGGGGGGGGDLTAVRIYLGSWIYLVVLVDPQSLVLAVCARSTTRLMVLAINQFSSVRVLWVQMRLVWRPWRIATSLQNTPTKKESAFFSVCGVYIYTLPSQFPYTVCIYTYFPPSFLGLELDVLLIAFFFFLTHRWGVGDAAAGTSTASERADGWDGPQQRGRRPHAPGRHGAATAPAPSCCASTSRRRRWWGRRGDAAFEGHGVADHGRERPALGR